MRIVILGTQPEYLAGLRGPVMRHFKAAGHEVHAIGASEMPDVRAALESWGIVYHVVPIRRASLSPLAEVRALWALYKMFRAIRPDAILAYTAKPVAFGLPIAAMAGIPRRYALIAGRGFAFLPGSEFRRRVARLAARAFYRIGLHFASGVIFQNEDDQRLFRSLRLVAATTPQTRVPGSGIDLGHFKPTPLPGGAPTFLMVSRLIRDKGIGEYLEAAAAVKQRAPHARILLVGPTDPSPNAVPLSDIEQAVGRGTIEYLGPSDDVRSEIARAHIFVLPSYAEGLPRSVLEAMAMGRPIITTDAPGCRDTVEAGRNGLLVPVRDSGALASAMLRFIDDPAMIPAMGQASMEIARASFDVEIVNRQIASFLDLGRPDARAMI